MTINDVKVKISPRMKCLAELCLPGKPMADIGTDHGFVPVYALSENRVPFAILTDINGGPLETARTNLEALRINPECYSLRLGNGLEPLKNGEVSSAVIAGMGGELIEDILEANAEKSHSVERFILQPRTHANDLRYYLSTHGYGICEYRLVKERGRICEVFAAENNPTAEADTGLISEFLLSCGDPLITEFVDYKISMAQTVLKSLENSDKEDSKDMKEIWNEILRELSQIRSNL